MANVEDLEVRVTADTSEALRAIKRVRRHLWLMQYGYTIVLAVTILLAVTLGFVAGVMVSG